MTNSVRPLLTAQRWQSTSQDSLGFTLQVRGFGGVARGVELRFVVFFFVSYAVNNKPAYWTAKATAKGTPEVYDSVTSYALWYRFPSRQEWSSPRELKGSFHCPGKVQRKKDFSDHHVKCCDGEKFTSSAKICTNMNCEVIKILQVLARIVMRNNKTIFNPDKTKSDHVPVSYLCISCTYGKTIEHFSWKGSTMIF